MVEHVPISVAFPISYRSPAPERIPLLTQDHFQAGADRFGGFSNTFHVLFGLRLVVRGENARHVGQLEQVHQRQCPRVILGRQFFVEAAVVRDHGVGEGEIRRLSIFFVEATSVRVGDLSPAFVATADGVVLEVVLGLETGQIRADEDIRQFVTVGQSVAEIFPLNHACKNDT